MTISKDPLTPLLKAAKVEGRGHVRLRRTAGVLGPHVGGSPRRRRGIVP
jgi:hypothetical protein